MTKFGKPPPQAAFAGVDAPSYFHINVISNDVAAAAGATFAP